MYWDSFFRGVIDQQIENRVERLFHQDVEFLKRQARLSTVEKQDLWKRLSHLRRVALTSRQKGDSDSSMEYENRYLSRQVKPSADGESENGASFLVSLIMTGVMMCFMFFSEVSGWEHPFAMTILLSFATTPLLGYRCARKRRPQQRKPSLGLRSFLSEYEHSVLVRFEIQVKKYQNEQIGGAGKKDAFQMQRFPEDFWTRKYKEVGQDMLDVLRLVSMLSEMLELEKDMIYSKQTKRREERDFRYFFRILYPIDETDTFSSDMTESYWEQETSLMEQATKALDDVIRLLQRMSKDDAHSDDESVDVQLEEQMRKVRTAESFEEERIHRVLEVVEDVRRRPDTEPEVKAFAEQTFQELRQMLDLSRRQKEQGQREWEDMKDVSTLLSIQSMLQVEKETTLQGRKED